MLILLKVILTVHLFVYTSGSGVVITTWKFTDATQEAWDYLLSGYSSIDAVVAGCSVCERNQCDTTVGYGGSPDESGETTLDAMIFDGITMNAGCVGNLRRVKHAISVARKILENTQHTLMVGDQVTNFAVQMGFREESLSTNDSIHVWEQWKRNYCQPNFWMNVDPDHTEHCGPYRPKHHRVNYEQCLRESYRHTADHDTIGMVVIDFFGNVASGTSTNGLKHKIPGRVGDSPIPGAGSYADNAVGGAAATGDGDLLLRFLPSFLAVEEMRRGALPENAAKLAIKRISTHYPNFSGAVIAVNIDGLYGAACNGLSEFPYSVINSKLRDVTVKTIKCQKMG